MRRSILKEKTKEELIPKPKGTVFEPRKSTVGMPVGIGDKSRAGWHIMPKEPPTPIEHKVAPGNANAMHIGRDFIKQGEKMPVLAVEGELEDVAKKPEEYIKRKVGSEGEPPKDKKLTIWEKLFGVKKEVGEVTPQYQPDAKMYPGKATHRKRR